METRDMACVMKTSQRPEDEGTQQKTHFADREMTSKQKQR